MNINVRQASRDDINEIVQMQQDLKDENIIYGFVPNNKEGLESKLGSYFLVAETENKIAGLVYGSVHQSEGLAVIPKDEQYLEIDDVYVKPEYRDKAIGQSLVNKIMGVAKENGIERFLVYSAAKDMNRIKRFYENVGFNSWYLQLFK